MSKEESYKYVYTKLVEVFPNKPWITAIAKLEANGRKVTVKKLADHIVAYGLCKWDIHENKKYNKYDLSAITEAISCSNNFLGLYHSLQGKEKIKIKARFKAAFTNPNDMRSITFELFISNYFKEKTYKVEYKDNDITGETYDYLIENTDGQEIQVECKSFSYDQGLFLLGDDAQKLSGMLLDRGININHEKPTGSITIFTVEMRESIPKSSQGKEQLVNEILNCFSKGNNKINDKFKFHLEYFYNVENISKTDASLKLPIKRHGIELSRAVNIPDGEKSRLCLRITTRAKNSFWRNFESVCNKAAKKQLCKDKAAIIAIHISNIEMFDDLLEDDRFINKVDNIFNQDHVVSLIIFSNIDAYEVNDYPYFMFSPLVKEFKNEKAKFSTIKKIV